MSTLEKLQAYCPEPTVLLASDYGVTGVGVEDAELQAFADAVKVASEADTNNVGVIAKFPAGTFTNTANNGLVTGVRWVSGSGKTVRIIGEGSDQTIAKRDAAVSSPKHSGQWYIHPRDGARFIFEGIQWDGNQANFAGNDQLGSFDWEHCASVKWYTAAGEPTGAEFWDCDFNNQVADGYSANVQTLTTLMINCTGRNRQRTRADSQHTYVPLLYARHINCQMEAIETEPHLQAPEGSYFEVKNCTIRGAWDMSRVILHAENVTQLSTEGVGLPFFNIYQTGAGSYLRNSSVRKTRRIQEAQIEISDTTFTTLDNEGNPQDVEIWNGLDSSDVKLINCTFQTESVGNAGNWLTLSSAHNSLEASLYVENPTFQKTLDYVLGGSGRGGTSQIVGGNCSANIGVINVGSGGGSKNGLPYIGHITLTANDTWSGRLFNKVSVNGPVTVIANGELNADNIILSNLPIESGGDLTVDFSGLRGTKTTPPDGSYQGLPGVIISSGGNDYQFTDGSWVNNGPTPI